MLAASWSIGTLFAPKTDALIAKACAISVTSTLEEFAAAANRLATRVASSAGRLKAFIALAVISAACPTPSPPAAARSSVPLIDDITSSALRPALASSNIPCAASPALKDVWAPSCSALALIAPMASAATPPTTWI